MEAYKFISSKCDRSPEHSERKYKSLCRQRTSPPTPPAPAVNYTGYCESAEVCFDIPLSRQDLETAPPGVTSMAYCASGRIAPHTLAHAVSIDKYGNTVDMKDLGGRMSMSGGPPRLAQAAVMNTSAPDYISRGRPYPNRAASAVTADSIQISAQSVHEIFGATSYMTLEGGLTACVQCASVALQPVPARTQSFDIKIVLPPGVTAVLVLLAVSF